MISPIIARIINRTEPTKNAEEKLEIKTAELERANEELKKFAYIVSHDLQEPLRMITGYIRLLEKKSETKLDAEEKEFINFIVDGSERMKKTD